MSSIMTAHLSNEIDTELCNLVATLNLNKVRPKESENPGADPTVSRDARDVTMLNSECQSLPNSMSCIRDEIYGCPTLQAIQSQLDSYSTTTGGYLEVIFSHRTVFAAFPRDHVECARGFSDLAFSLERRAWRADREDDQEAVNAFRYEAWIIANSL